MNAAVYFQPQAKREPPIRLFRSPFLEALTHIHPVVVVVVWVPVIGWYGHEAWTSRAATGTTEGELFAAAALGLLVWTLVEYGMHRFVFHWRFAATREGQVTAFLTHGYHHAYPRDPTRLVLPPLVLRAPIGLAHHLDRARRPRARGREVTDGGVQPHRRTG